MSGLVTSDCLQRLGSGHDSAQGAVFVQVAEHLDADGLVQATHADRFVAADADQVGDQVAGGGVVRGVELDRALGFLQKAEEEYETQVSTSRNAGGGGGGGSQMAQELADLFELELDRMANQYETADRAMQQNSDQIEQFYEIDIPAKQSVAIVHVQAMRANIADAAAFISQAKDKEILEGVS